MKALIKVLIKRDPTLDEKYLLKSWLKIVKSIKYQN